MKDQTRVFYELRYCYFNISNENLTQLLETIVKIPWVASVIHIWWWILGLWPSGNYIHRMNLYIYLQEKWWLQRLPNYIDISNVTKWMGICENYWKHEHKFTLVQGRSKKPIHSSTKFCNIPQSLLCHYGH